MTDIEQRRSRDDCVICPACTNEFIATPVAIQDELVSLRQQLEQAKDANTMIQKNFIFNAKHNMTKKEKQNETHHRNTGITHGN